MADLLQLIKQGVKLKPLRQQSQSTKASQLSATPSDKHAQQLKEALDRISKRLNQPSDDEGEDSQDSDFQDFD